KAILHGVKLAAYGFAVLLACIVVYHIMSPPLGAPVQAPVPVDVDAAVVEPPPEPVPVINVPPPPPVPGQEKKSNHPRTTPRPVAPAALTPSKPIPNAPIPDRLPPVESASNQVVELKGGARMRELTAAETAELLSEGVPVPSQTPAATTPQVEKEEAA